MITIFSGDYLEVNTKEYNGKPYYLEKTIKASENVKIPVILIGGIRDYDTMINILKDSKIEYFGLVRPLICEPDLPKYWKKNVNRKSKYVFVIDAYRNMIVFLKEKIKKILRNKYILNY